MFNAAALRAYTSDDVAGIELGGALKNIFAIAAGVSDGLGFGDNAKAALVTRSLAELVRLGVRLGGRRETFQGSERHRRPDGDVFQPSQPQPVRSANASDGAKRMAKQLPVRCAWWPKGVPTARSAFACAREHGLGTPTPVTDQVHAVLYENLPPRRRHCAACSCAIPGPKAMRGSSR